MRRRDFLIHALGTGLAAAPLSASQRVRPAGVPLPGIIDVGNEKQLFLDDGLIAERSRISNFVYRPDKCPRNPILTADKPWELETDQGIQLDAQATLYDPQEKLFKMWYLPQAFPAGGRPWCYAVSDNGIDWVKPELGLIEYRGSKNNNLLRIFDTKIDLCYSNVVKTPHDSDPRRLYKAMGELENGPIANRYGGAAVAFSPDGLRWTDHPQNPVIKHGVNIADAPTMFGWDAWKQKYVAYPRPGHPLAREINGNGVHRHIRTIGYAESDDFIHWTPTRVMLAPDDDDRVDSQFGQFVARQCANFYVGFLMVHQTHEQTWGVFLVSSRDGFHWNWVDRHTPFLLRGETGSYDGGYQSLSGPITHDGRIWIYYGAFSGAHSEVETRLGKSRMSIALATLPEDRWLGLLAGPDRGTIVTKPLLFKGTKLFVDLDGSVPQSTPGPKPNFDECDVRVELLDQSGGRIDGFALERSVTLTQSGRQQITWGDADLAKLQDKPVRLRFQIRNAALYSIQFA